ncbi:MAG: hypothetical protein LBF72_03420 [Holosporales bacterium]|nr:hypothetical protein [Holosporales bacterium]
MLMRKFVYGFAAFALLSFHSVRVVASEDESEIVTGDEEEPAAAAAPDAAEAKKAESVYVDEDN